MRVNMRTTTAAAAAAAAAVGDCTCGFCLQTACAELRSTLSAVLPPAPVYKEDFIEQTRSRGYDHMLTDIFHHLPVVSHAHNHHTLLYVQYWYARTHEAYDIINDTTTNICIP